MSRRDPVERFWEKVDKNGPGDCWIWTASVTGPGYGQFGHAAGDIRLAHRYSWELLIGPLPKGQPWQLDHLCKNRRCVNPEHLELVTHAENLRRGDGFGGQNARKTHCKQGHPLSGDNIWLIQRSTRKNPSRVCKICAAAAAKRTREKKKRELECHARRMHEGAKAA